MPNREAFLQFSPAEGTKYDRTDIESEVRLYCIQKNPRSQNRSEEISCIPSTNCDWRQFYLIAVLSLLSVPDESDSDPPKPWIDPEPEK